MTNYSESYPQCANCPRLTEWQDSRDDMTRSFETASLNDKSRIIIANEEFEQQRVAMDEKFAAYTDRADAGDIPGPVYLEAKDLYDKVEETTAKQAKRQKKDEEFFNNTANFLTSIADGEVALMTDGCHGALEVSILGFHKVFCRSRLPRSISVRPFPPMPQKDTN